MPHHLTALRDSWSLLAIIIMCFSVTVDPPHWGLSSMVHAAGNGSLNETAAAAAASPTVPIRLSLKPHRMKRHIDGALNTSTASSSLSSVFSNSDTLASPIVRSDTENIHVHDGDNFWMTSISLGTPRQNFQVAVDTGSTDLYVNTRGCDNCDRKLPFYNEHASSTYSGKGSKSGVIHYGGGSGTHGMSAKDKLTLGSLTTHSQTFMKISHSQYPHMAGIMGLSSNRNAYGGGHAVLENLFRQHKDVNPVFSIYFPSNTAAVQNAELLIGGIDHQHYSGHLHRVTLDPPRASGWTVNVSHYRLGHGERHPIHVQALLDSGDNHMKITQYLMDDLQRPITDKKITLQEACANKKMFPSLFLTIGDKEWEIRHHDYMSSQWEPGKCGFVVSGWVNKDYWNLGVTFLRRVYTVFDYRKRVVRMAYRRE